MTRPRLALLSVLFSLSCGGVAAPPAEGPVVVERDVAVPMRDGVVLRADVYRPRGSGPFPTLVYRTPYGREKAAERYDTHRKAVARGYAVVLQDVRGRYGSGGVFDPYRNEGRDGYDTIEWAASRPWSNGDVGTYGLSYPGAVQWLAALEEPPRLMAMVPAMTFSSPRHFFYFGGVFDRSWVPWITLSIAPDIRRRGDLPGPRTDEEARRHWERHGDEIQSRLPLSDVPELEGVAPFYFEWLRHPPDDPWWDFGEVRGRYERVDAAVLNLSGWHDEAYGPEGAVVNFQGLVESRRGEASPRTRLVVGPWTHGVDSVGETRFGELDFGPSAVLDYDALVLDWMDRWLKGETSSEPSPPVRLFVMGANEWRSYDTWPPASVEPWPLYLGSGSGGLRLEETVPSGDEEASVIASDPARPVVDPFGGFGPHDLAELRERDDVLAFETPPLEESMEVIGRIEAEIHLSCDCRDTDLWVTVLDVAPDGAAHNLMSPGSNVLRASYRDLSRGRQLLEPGSVYRLTLDDMLTAHRFDAGHRIRMLLSTSFAPYLSRNLHSGELESDSATMRPAVVRIHHDAEHPSRLRLPVAGER